MAGTGKKCGASYIPKTATCNKGMGVRAAVGITAGAVVVGAVSSHKVRRQMGTISTKTKLYVQNKVAGAIHKAGFGATPAKASMKFSSPRFNNKLRRQNHLNNARLMVHKMRRKHEPGFRNSKKPFWADGFEGELQAGLFHMDKKCGASGIPENAKCTKGVGQAAPKRNIIEKIGRKISGAEKREKNEKAITALKKKYGANSPEANGGEALSPKGATYKWIKKNRPNLDPDKIGANSPLAMKIAEKYVDSVDPMELTPATLRADACWKGYVQAGTKRKGNRTVPNCVPAGKAKAAVKRKTGQDGEDKLTSAKRAVWAEGFEPKKTKARR